jgi:hypothetical protein
MNLCGGAVNFVYMAKESTTIGVSVFTAQSTHPGLIEVSYKHHWIHHSRLPWHKDGRPRPALTRMITKTSPRA